VGGEALFRKTVDSAFIGTDLAKHLERSSIDSLVVVGLTTEHCVSTSVRMAANLGFKVTLVPDATAAFEHHGADGMLYSADVVHNINLASLNGEFRALATTGGLLDAMG
jgi:nicotinamidase-related amidase